MYDFPRKDIRKVAFANGFAVLGNWKIGRFSLENRSKYRNDRFFFEYLALLLKAFKGKCHTRISLDRRF